MCEFSYDYVKRSYGVKANLCCMDTGSFILYIKAFANILQKMLKLGTSNYELECNAINGPLPKGKNLNK